MWDALNNPDILRQSLPGCEVFAATSDTEFEVALTAKVGPVKAKFKGEVALSDVNPPVSYRISGSGKGGVAGFAKGGAEVSLESADDGQSTLMSYRVAASVGGKLAQIGSRLVTGAARKMADDFFTGFVRVVTGNPEMTVDIETLDAEQAEQEKT